MMCWLARRDPARTFLLFRTIRLMLRGCASRGAWAIFFDNSQWG
jgi:hypothetical protein